MAAPMIFAVSSLMPYRLRVLCASAVMSDLGPGSMAQTGRLVSGLDRPGCQDGFTAEARRTQRVANDVSDYCLGVLCVSAVIPRPRPGKKPRAHDFHN